jgi:hypothetical protein
MHGASRLSLAFDTSAGAIEAIGSVPMAMKTGITPPKAYWNSDACITTFQ